VAETGAVTPLLLFDKVVAHLDRARRAALFVAPGTLGGKVRLSGADPPVFAGSGDTGEVGAVESGRLLERQK